MWVKVLKRIYFPNSDFGQASKGSRASWAWTSILEGRKVMTEGAVWSVGDGKQIRPFMDAWIPGRYESRLGARPVTQQQANLRLHEWIDPGSKTWLVNKVREAVCEEEAEAVLSVPIPLISSQDKLRWPFERRGSITVRSAYHRIRDRQSAQEDQTGRGECSWGRCWESGCSSECC